MAYQVLREIENIIGARSPEDAQTQAEDFLLSFVESIFIAVVLPRVPADSREDVIQDAWMKLLTRADRRLPAIAERPEPVAEFRGWLTALAAWACRDWYRARARRRDGRHLSFDPPADPLPGAPLPLLIDEFHESSPQQRQLVRLLADGQSKSESAKLLGVSPSKVTRLIKLLRRDHENFLVMKG